MAHVATRTYKDAQPPCAALHMLLGAKAQIVAECITCQEPLVGPVDAYRHFRNNSDCHKETIEPKSKNEMAAIEKEVTLVEELGPQAVALVPDARLRLLKDGSIVSPLKLAFEPAYAVYFANVLRNTESESAKLLNEQLVNTECKLAAAQKNISEMMKETDVRQAKIDTLEKEKKNTMEHNEHMVNVYRCTKAKLNEVKQELHKAQKRLLSPGLLAGPNAGVRSHPIPLFSKYTYSGMFPDAENAATGLLLAIERIQSPSTLRLRTFNPSLDPVLFGEFGPIPDEDVVSFPKLLSWTVQVSADFHDNLDWTRAMRVGGKALLLLSQAQASVARHLTMAVLNHA